MKQAETITSSGAGDSGAAGIAVAPADREPGHAQPGGSRRARRLPAQLAQWASRHRADLLATGAYLLLGLLMTGHLWRHINHRVLVYGPADHTFLEWMLVHGARTVSHLSNPFYSTQMNAPDGVNIMANTGILGLSLPLSPITLLFGPNVAFATLVVVALSATATTWYWLLSRHVVESRLAAAIGGGLCGFGPGVVAHASGQPNLSAQFLVPIILWQMVRLTQPKARPIRVGVALGLLVTWQAFINEEILFFTAMAGAVLAVLWAIQHRTAARAALRTVLTGGLTAAGIAGTLLAYPLAVQFFGPGHYRGLPFDTSLYNTDVFAYGAFARASLGGDPVTGLRLSLSPNEDSTFFGWPMLILVLLICAWLWRRPLLRLVAGTGLLFALLSLGQRLSINGHPTRLPGPFLLFADLPVVNLSIPARYGLVVTACVGVVVALGVDAAQQAAGKLARPRPWRLVTATLLIAALLPMVPTPLPAKGRPDEPTFISSGQWRSYVGPGRTLVPVPLPFHTDPTTMWWSIMQREDIAIPRGYFLGPTSPTNPQAIFGAPPRHTATVLDAASATDAVPILTAADRTAALADLRYWKASVVVLAPGPREETLWRTVTDLLGFRPQWIGGLWLWDVRDLVKP